MTYLEKLVQSAERASEAYACDPSTAHFIAYVAAERVARDEFEFRIHSAYEIHEAEVAK